MMTLKSWSTVALLLCGAAASVPAAAFGVLTVKEDRSTGYTGVIPTSAPAIQIASDGEAVFRPFGLTFDVSDAIVLNADWAPDPKYRKAFATGYWTQVPGSFTWVLPACNASGCENANIVEPIARWYYAPGGGWSPGTLSVKMVDANGAFSDMVTVANNGPGGSATIKFQSGGTVPEPMSWALMVAGFGLVGTTLRRRGPAAVAA